MKRIFLAVFIAALLTASFAFAEDPQPPSDAAPMVTDSVVVPDTLAADRIVVTYFHGNRRCATCMKLEAYSHEAVTSGFGDDLAAGTVEWRVVNFDDEANQHYTKDYGLYSQSLVLSHVVDGKEVSWKNLDKIWELVGDKDKFVPYVQSSTRDFMNPPTED